MKSTLMNLTAGLVLAATIVSCNQEEKKASAPATSTTSTGKPEIVYVNSDSLLTNYEQYKEIKARMDEKGKKAQADLVEKGNAFQREVQQAQKDATTMSADDRAKLEQRLARKQQELGAFRENAGAALQNDQAAENEKAYDKVADYLKTYAKEKGYKMILTYSKGNSAIIYGDESLDVTKEVVAGLNAAYKKK